MRSTLNLMVAAVFLASAIPSLAANQYVTASRGMTIVSNPSGLGNVWIVLACRPDHNELILSHRIGFLYNDSTARTEQVLVGKNDVVDISDVGFAGATAMKVIDVIGCTGTFWIH